MTKKIEYAISPYTDSETNERTKGVTVYGINEGLDAFEPLFYSDTRFEAEQIVKKLCEACNQEDCPDWKREINACYNYVDHG